MSVFFEQTAHPKALLTQGSKHSVLIACKYNNVLFSKDQCLVQGGYLVPQVCVAAFRP